MGLGVKPWVLLPVQLESDVEYGVWHLVGHVGLKWTTMGVGWGLGAVRVGCFGGGFGGGLWWVWVGYVGLAGCGGLGSLGENRRQTPAS